MIIATVSFVCPERADRRAAMLRQPAAQPLPALGGILSQSERRRLPLPAAAVPPRERKSRSPAGRKPTSSIRPRRSASDGFDFGPHLPRGSTLNQCRHGGIIEMLPPFSGGGTDFSRSVYSRRPTR
jgi:hypothetical protein